MMRPEVAVYTIGHSAHAFDAFVVLLREARVAAIADVRSVPYSRWQPQFNRDALRNRLAELGISYAFLGVELGGRGADSSVRDKQGRVQYGRVAASPAFRAGLSRIRARSE